jgi:hypothetical protein
MIVTNALLMAVLVGGPAPDPTPRPLGPEAMVAGHRVDAYPALWWQWVNRKRWGAQAFQDPTGAQCALNQRGAVWFLAGTDGTDAALRRCRVPYGKYVFLPVITMLVTSRPGEVLDCRTAQSLAARNNEHAIATEISLDGRRFELAGLRIRSECFNAYELADYLRAKEEYSPSASDGYWLMFPPLPPGKHVLRVNVRYDNPGSELGELEQEFEYELEIDALNGAGLST